MKGTISIQRILQYSSSCGHGGCGGVVKQFEFISIRQIVVILSEIGRHIVRMEPGDCWTWWWYTKRQNKYTHTSFGAVCSVCFLWKYVCLSVCLRCCALKPYKTVSIVPNSACRINLTANRWVSKFLIRSSVCSNFQVLFFLFRRRNTMPEWGEGGLWAPERKRIK